MKTASPLLLLLIGFLVALPVFAGDPALPEKLRSVLDKLDEFETAQIATAEAAIEKKRAEVSAFLNREMQQYAQDGKIDTALELRQIIQGLESGSPLSRIQSGNGDPLTIAADRAQRVFREKDFKDFGKSWSGNSIYTPLAKRGVLQLTVNGAGPKYEAIGVTIPVTDFTQRPVLRIRARAEKAVVMRIDLQDASGKGTTNWPVHEKIQRTGEFRDYFFDFSRYADEGTAVDLSRIQTMVIYVNPGADPFKGAVYFDEIESAERRG